MTKVYIVRGLGMGDDEDAFENMGAFTTKEKALELIKEVSQVVRQKTLAQWTDIFASVDCCVTPVLTIAEAMTHPLFIERGVVKADANQACWLQSPVRFS
mgnify:CR=1 FL=1